jgi:hypothetical protein
MSEYKSKVTAVSVSVTQSIKLSGDLVSITLSETRELEGASDFDAVIVRTEISEALQEQGQDFLNKAKANAPVQAPRPVAQAPAPVQVAQAAVQAAVHTPATAGGGWMSVPSRFGDGDIRFLPTSVYSTMQLETDIAAFLAQHNLDIRFFKVWDNRPGPRGMEAGTPSGAVAAVKLNDGAPGKEQLGNNAAVRVKFNNDGSLYCWFTKEFEAALKFIGPSLATYETSENSPW